MDDLRSRILAKDDRPFADVEVPEWDETVRVRGLNAKDAGEFAERWSGDEEDEGADSVMGALADILIKTLEDPETSEQLFTEADRDALSEKGVPPLKRLMELAVSLSGLDEDMETVKNDSRATQVESSP